MSDHLASMNEQVTSQNDKIDRLQQQLHINPKVNFSQWRFRWKSLESRSLLGREERQKMNETHRRCSRLLFVYRNKELRIHDPSQFFILISS